MTTDDPRARLYAMRTELVEMLAQNGVDQPSHAPAVVGIDAALEALAEMPAAENMPTPEMLRGRLRQVREGALFGLARYGTEPTRLSLAAGAHAALEALDEAPICRRVASRVATDDTKVEAAVGCRVVVSGAPGAPIRLTLYNEAGTAAAVELDSAGANLLAHELIDAALQNRG